MTMGLCDASSSRRCQPASAMAPSTKRTRCRPIRRRARGRSASTHGRCTNCSSYARASRPSCTGGGSSRPSQMATAHPHRCGVRSPKARASSWCRRSIATLTVTLRARSHGAARGRRALLRRCHAPPRDGISGSRGDGRRRRHREWRGVQGAVGVRKEYVTGCTRTHGHCGGESG
jgi:hypothetical protein